jgi:hypothetical protein
MPARRDDLPERRSKQRARRDEQIIRREEEAPWGVNGDAVSVVTYNPGPDMAYTMWFGNICGALGFGYGDGCTCC